MKDCAEFYCRQSVEKVLFRIVAICITKLERLIQISLLFFSLFLVCLFSLLIQLLHALIN